MTFDPFGDFETRGYLRNFAGEKDPKIVRRLEHMSFTTGIDSAFDRLATIKPGEIMGYLAYGHPFLDGNGRTIMVVHGVLAKRAGFSVDWPATTKSDYLSALTKELDTPGKGHLDSYLRPFLREAVADDRLAAKVAQAPGLDGNSRQNEVLGKTNDAALQARYERQELKRKWK